MTTTRPLHSSHGWQYTLDDLASAVIEFGGPETRVHVTITLRSDLATSQRSIVRINPHNSRILTLMVSNAEGIADVEGNEIACELLSQGSNTIFLVVGSPDGTFSVVVGMSKDKSGFCVPEATDPGISFDLRQLTDVA